MPPSYYECTELAFWGESLLELVQSSDSFSISEYSSKKCEAVYQILQL